MSSSALQHALLTRTPLVQPAFENDVINSYRGETKSPKEQILTLLTLKGHSSPQQLVWYLQLPHDEIVDMLQELDQEKKTYSIPPYNGGQVKRGTKWFLRGRERFNRVLDEMEVELSETPIKMTAISRLPPARRVLPFPLDREILKKLKKRNPSTTRKLCYSFGVAPTRKNAGAVRAALGTLERKGKARHAKRGKHKVLWFAEGG